MIKLKIKLNLKPDNFKVERIISSTISNNKYAQYHTGLVSSSYIKYFPKINFFFIIFIFSILSNQLFGQSRFDYDLWKKICADKECNVYKPKDVLPEDWKDIVVYSSSVVTGFKQLEGLGFELPYESELSFSGRKTIGVRYGFGKYLDAEKARLTGTPPGANGFDMSQELQVRVAGRVGKKITVNVNYDDTTEGKRDLSVVYKGFKKGDVIDDKGNIAQKDELIQSAEFGDINLYIPSTEFAGYSKNVFGLRADGKYKNFKFFGIGSRTKGIVETVRFKGNTSFTKADIRDISYIRRKYYKIDFTNQPQTDFPIIPGSERIYLDDRIASNNTINTTTEGFEDYNNPKSTGTGDFDLLMPGQDYTIDLVNKVITFKKQILPNYIIIIDYKNKNGEYISFSTGRKKLLKWDENDKTINFSNELKNYYSLQAVKILKGTLGRDFILKVIDLSRNAVSDFDNIFDKVEIDFETGIFRFIDQEPFKKYFSDIYQDPNPVSHFIIYAEYKFRVKSFNLNKPSIVIGSERVIMNGKVLVKDMDYILDYDSGFITFFNEDKIDEDTDIEITYEYMPFGGQFQQTLVGLRGEYDPGNGDKVGSTILYSGSGAPQTVPNVRSTPESVTLLDVDGSYRINPLSNVTLNLSFEGARSMMSPNVFGKALVENMEGIKLSDSMPVLYELWRKSSNYGSGISDKDSLVWTNEEENSRKINPGNTNLTSDAKQNVLKISYNLENDSISPLKNKSSIVYPISNIGVDFSKKQYLELWMDGDNSGEEVIFTFGSISEDADGQGGFLKDIYDNTGRLIWKKGQPKTEDLNGDGTLNLTEDVGWDYIISVGPDGIPGTPDDIVEKVGAGNGRLDSEDLNGDGYLNPDNGTGATFGFSKKGTVDYQMIDGDGNIHDKVDFTGWKYFKVPFEITDSNKDRWVAIKHIRITIKNDDLLLKKTGSIRIASLSMVGNKWEKPVITPVNGSSVTISALNNEENPNYISIMNFNEYKELYPEITTENKREQAFSFGIVDLQPGTTVFTKLIFTKALDFSKYKTFSFFLWGDGSNMDFFMDLCTNENDYYQYRTKLNFIGWKLIKATFEDKNGDGKMDDFTKFGNNQSLVNIIQLRFGLCNSTSVSIKNSIINVNDIFLQDVIEIDGSAYRFNADLNVPGWFNLGSKYRRVEKDFSTINSGNQQGTLTGTSIASGGQDNTSLSGNFSTGLIKFLPLNVSASKNEIITPTSYGFNQLSSLVEGRVQNITGNANTTLSVPYLPQINLNYDKSLSDTKPPNLTQPKKLEDRDSYSGSTGFTFPIRFFIFPQNISASYKRTNYFLYYFNQSEQSSGTITSTQLSSGNITIPQTIQTLPENYREFSQDFSASTNFSFFSIINFSPSISRNSIIEERDIITSTGAKLGEYWFIKSQNQTASISGGLRIFSWLSPGFNYTISHQETFNNEKSSETLKIYEKNKNLTRNSSGEVSLGFSIKDIIGSFKPTESISLNGSYRMEDGDQFEKLNPKFNSFEQLIIRDQNLSISDTDIKNGARRINLSARDTLRLSSRWKPFEFLSFKGVLLPFSTIDLTGNYSNTADKREVTGTPQLTNTLNWPDIIANVNNIENFFILNFIKKRITGTGINLKYLKKTVETVNISNSQSLSQGFTLNLKLLEKVDINANYNKTNDVEYNYINKSFTRKTNSESFGISTGLNFNREFQVGAWRVTPSYSQGTQVQYDASGRPTQDAKTVTVSVQVHSDFLLPPKWTVPFIKKVVSLSNRLILDSTVKGSFMRSAINVERDNTNTFNLIFSANYDVSKNLNLTMSGAVNRFYNTFKPKEDYYNVEFSGKLSIVF